MTELEIKKIIKNCFVELNGNSPEDEERLFDHGHLDSFGMVQFILLLEEKLEISFDPNEVTLENFANCNNIANLIVVKNAR